VTRNRGTFLFAAVIAASVLSVRARAAEPPAGGVVSLRLVADSAPLVAGEPVRLALVADIQAGWHINSHTPKEDFLIPTVAAVAPAEGIRLGAPVYPRHVEKKFAFSEQTVAVY